MCVCVYVCMSTQRDQRPRLSMLCEEALYRQERENADDIRLSVRLFVNCKEDKKRFCADVEPGGCEAHAHTHTHERTHKMRNDPGKPGGCIGRLAYTHIHTHMGTRMYTNQHKRRCLLKI